MRTRIFALFVLLVAMLVPATTIFAGENYCTDVKLEFSGDAGSSNTNILTVSGHCHGGGRYRVSLWIDYPGQEVPYDPSFGVDPGIPSTYFSSRSGYDIGVYTVWMKDSRGVEYYNFTFEVGPDYQAHIISGMMPQ